KSLEPFAVQRPQRRELIQDRTKRASEAVRAREQPAERLNGLFQFFHVREESTGLHGEQESARHAAFPCGERRRSGEAIKRVVDLDRVESPGVKLQPATLREGGGIEVVAPVFVLPAGAADANGWG